MSQARRTARADAAHAAATAPHRWRCKVPACPVLDVWHPATDAEAAFYDADRHYTDRHQTDPPYDLEAQRARWVAAGRPPLGIFPAHTA